MRHALPTLAFAVVLNTAFAIQPPNGLISLAGDRSIILHWNRTTNTDLAGYHVYRSVVSASGPFYVLNTGLLTSPGYCDLSSAVINGQTNFYYVTAVDTTSAESSPSLTVVAAVPHAFASDDKFLDYIQEGNFDYFWYLANPANGLIPDRTATDSLCSIAAVGFGLTAIGIGIDHGWITRDQGAARVLTTLNTFLSGPQGPATSGTIGYKGWFYHFLDMNTALRGGNSELSSVDTTWLLAGVLYAKQYFNGTNATETGIRTKADAIFNRVDWNWMAQGTDAVSMGWNPPGTFISATWRGYNEAMLLYLLGMGAATNPLPASCWSYWTSGYIWATYYGQSFVLFPPLFGHQYSHCWVDFRHIADPYMTEHHSTYFENSRRATLAQIGYCVANPLNQTGYGSNVWGLTASDVPNGYRARGAPPAQNDDGTIAPTGPGGSIAFTPEQSLSVLKHLYNQYRQQIWTAYGFRDAFNLGASWWDTDELGIDQGPIVIMIENYRTQRVWKLFMRNSEIQRGLQRAGFVTLPAVPLKIKQQSAQDAIDLSWTASAGSSYQVEYSQDLRAWEISPGFVQPMTSGTFNWLDSGPPATVSDPRVTPTRFYRVFQVSQLLLNSGFETAGSGGIYMAANWTTYGACNRETWAAHSGSYGMAHEWWNGSTSGFYQDVAATPGATYTLSAWCLDDAAAVATSVYTMKLEYYNSSLSLLGSDTKNISSLVSNYWQLFTLADHAIPASTAIVRAAFDASNMVVTNETLKIDDVYLTSAVQ